MRRCACDAPRLLNKKKGRGKPTGYLFAASQAAMVLLDSQMG